MQLRTCIGTITHCILYHNTAPNPDMLPMVANIQYDYQLPFHTEYTLPNIYSHYSIIVLFCVFYFLLSNPLWHLLACGYIIDICSWHSIRSCVGERFILGVFRVPFYCYRVGILWFLLFFPSLSLSCMISNCSMFRVSVRRQI